MFSCCLSHPRKCQGHPSRKLLCDKAAADPEIRQPDLGCHHELPPYTKTHKNLSGVTNLQWSWPAKMVAVIVCRMVIIYRNAMLQSWEHRITIGSEVILTCSDGSFGRRLQNSMMTSFSKLSCTMNGGSRSGSPCTCVYSRDIKQLTRWAVINFFKSETDSSQSWQSKWLPSTNWKDLCLMFTKSAVPPDRKNESVNSTCSTYSFQ